MPGRNTNWLQGQDSNLRYRGYEPRGLDRTCPPCEKKARRTQRVRQPGASWRGEEGQYRAGRTSCSLLGTNRPRDTRRPSHAFRPILGKPRNNLVVFSQRECLVIAQTRKESAISGAMPPDRRFSQVAGGGETFAEREKMSSELSFHGVVIVGCVPHFNRKHPSRQDMWKFPMVFL